MSERLRLLCASSENGNREEVLLTEDFDTPASEFFWSGLEVTHDITISTSGGDSFMGLPLNYNLLRT